MPYSYCTLFDQNYLDKGILMLRSIRKVNNRASLYVLAMDERCFKVLSDMKLAVVIHLSDFLNEELISVRENRTRAEFCWTCTASFIRYIFDIYKEEYCTYIDADMYFFSDPDVLIKEMVMNKKSVSIIEHRIKNNFLGRIRLQNAGTYCVEFNTFKNDIYGRAVLDDWCQKTIEHCSSDTTGGKPLGDQSYLEDWTDRFDCVHVIQNKGAGIAPWNIERYRIITEISERPSISYDGRGKYSIIFYHYHNLQYYTKNTVNINVFTKEWGADIHTVYFFYYSYLIRVNDVKKEINDKYGIYPILNSHPGITKNPQQEIGYYLKRLFSRQLFILLNYRFQLWFLRKRNTKKDIIIID